MVLCCLAAGGCVPPGTQDSEPSTSFPPPPRAAYVDVQGRYPVQANLILTWPGCRWPNTLAMTRGQNGDFVVTVTTQQAQDGQCPGHGQSWDQVIPLDVAGLAAGAHEVEVNGLATTFELPVAIPPAADATVF